MFGLLKRIPIYPCPPPTILVQAMWPESQLVKASCLFIYETTFFVIVWLLQRLDIHGINEKGATELEFIKKSRLLSDNK